MTTTTPDEIAVQPSLAGLELPEYHGRKPAGMKSNISGTSNRTSQAHEIGSTVVFLVEARVTDSGHREVDGEGLLYVEKFSAKDVFEIPGAQGKRLLSTVRSAYRTAKEGDLPLPVDAGSEVKTDASGVVITPGDALSIGDDPLVRSLTDESLTPVVILYSDGARELWPDEFDPGDPRPVIGSKVLDEKDVESTVVKILHGESGETLEEWTEEQEDARLLDAERDAERAEALEEFERLRDLNEKMELEGEVAERFVELRERFEDEARADRAVMEEISGAPADQVDPAEANEDLDGDPEDTFPGYAGDEPDGELSIDVDVDEPGEEPLADVVPIGGDDPARIVIPDPTADDYAFIEREVKDLLPMVAELTDRNEVLGYLAAESLGRVRGPGKHLKPRKGVIDSLTKRAAVLFTEEGFASPDLPAAPEGFEPGASDDEWED